MEIKTKLHTIFLMIGPSNCGKSTFVENIINQSKYSKSTFKHISSDNIRRDLLGNDFIHKHDPRMMYVSEQAFDLLFSQLRNHTSYPVNTPIVFVDTTGLSEEFRKQVIKVAKDNHYNIEAIVFDYKSNDDYYKFMRESESKFVINKHIKKLRRETLPRTSLKFFNNIHRIRKVDELDSVVFKIEDYDTYKDYKLDDDVEYEIVGDIHSNFDALKNIILKNITMEDVANILNDTYQGINKKYILIGDWIDKGTQTKEIIDLLYKNQHAFILLKGNHENFVYKYLKDEIPELPPQDVIDNYFTSIKEFEADSELREKFFELVESSKDFYVHKDFIVTHAPCSNKYLGKLDSRSLRNQRYVKLPREDEYKTNKEYIEALESTLSFVKEDARVNYPIHVFGHVAFQRRLQYKNKYGIDTGCGDDNKLTSVIINGYGKKPFFSEVKVGDEGSKLPVIFKPKIDIKDISDEALRFIKRMARNKVNYISGTMSPADKDMDKFELESLEKGLLYYKDKGIEQVILQPKYMGSRCQLYLYEDIDKCYAVSRNGYRISKVDLSGVYESMRNKFFDLNDYSKELIIVDGELMPWFTLGQNLIENQYVPIRESLGVENTFLEENDFDFMYSESVLNKEVVEFRKDQIENRIGKDELIKKYGHSKYETYTNLLDFYTEFIGEDLREVYLEAYKRQIELYGQDTTIHFKPFDILKTVYKDGTETIENNPFKFIEISDDNYMILNIADNSKYLETASAFFNEIATELQMEGIVIKPNVISETYAPYIKVRNKDYLTLVYGYDYKRSKNYNKLINQKNISRKLRLSISEFNLTNKLLHIPYNEIEFENGEYFQLVTKLVANLRQEKELDPRL